MVAVWSGDARYGDARYGEVRRGMVRLANHSNKVVCKNLWSWLGEVGFGMVLLGEVGFGMVLLGVAGRGKVRLGEVWRGKVHFHFTQFQK